LLGCITFAFCLLSWVNQEFEGVCQNRFRDRPASKTGIFNYSKVAGNVHDKKVALVIALPRISSLRLMTQLLESGADNDTVRLLGAIAPLPNLRSHQGPSRPLE
jgi:hypothetical protein